MIYPNILRQELIRNHLNLPLYLVYTLLVDLLLFLYIIYSIFFSGSQPINNFIKKEQLCIRAKERSLMNTRTPQKACPTDPSRMHREARTHTHFAGDRNAGHPNTTRCTFSPHSVLKRSARDPMDSMAVSHQSIHNTWPRRAPQVQSEPLSEEEI